MSAALIAATEIRQLTNKFKGLIALGDYLEGVGRLEQMSEECKAAADKAQAATVGAQAELNLALTAKADAVREAESIKDAAQNEAAVIVATARADRERITGVAKVEAEQIREAAAHVATEAQLRLEEKYNELHGLDLAIGSKHEELERITAALAEARAKLGV